jgi:inosine-uridine nucleoside N-ribohydrolase
MPFPCLIDTDCAIDDWMAILYLLSSPQADVRAITVAATGEAHAKPGVRTVQGLLALTSTRGVQVAAGRSTPLRGGQAFPLLLRLAMDVRLLLRLPKPLEPVSDMDAAAVLTQAITTSPQPVTIVALGPLTNLAEALLAKPSLTEKIARIVIMGGALRVAGNIPEINPRIHNPYAEWNIFCDPYAADVVFQSGAAITLVPLDATNQAPLNDAFVEQLATGPATPASQFVVQAIRRIQRLLRGQTFYLWDPLAAVIAVRDSLAVKEQVRLRVCQEPGPELGRVVEDPDGGFVDVCTAVDRVAFEQEYLQALAHSLGMADH